MYCIVDLETTGGKGNKITEIAILKFDGDKITDEFVSLVNPECTIPYFITQLTGITNDMVAGAPKFYELAKSMVEFMADTTFVAHNVFFDFNVLKKEFQELGYDFKTDKLCTVKLARRVFPGHASYSLGKICPPLGINIKNRHRARGDAEATVELFKLILSKLSQEQVKSETSSEHKLLLPSTLASDTLTKAPERAGVYYLRDEQGQILYIGKSINIKKRLAQHFRVDLKKARDVELKNKVAQIDYETTSHELAALVLEASEIKKNRPPYNRALNRVRFRYAIEIERNATFYRPKITTHVETQPNLALHFRSRHVATKVLTALFRDQFSLDFEAREFEAQFEKWCLVLGPAVINERILNWFARYEYQHKCETLIYHERELSLELVIDQGQLKKIHLKGDEISESYMVEEDPDIKRLVLSYLRKKKLTSSHELE